MKFSEIIIDGYSNLEKTLNNTKIPEILFSSEFVDLNYSTWIFQSFFAFSGFPPPIPFRFKFEDTVQSKEDREFLESFLGNISLRFASFLLSFFFPLASLIKLLRIDNTNLLTSLSYHNYRNIIWVLYVMAFYVFLLVIFMPFTVSIPIVSLLFASSQGAGQTNPPFWVELLSYSAIIISPLFLLLWIMVPLRLTFRNINRYFAETICIRESLHLLLDLKDDDIFIHHSRKRILQYRINYLAQTTILIASRYVSKDKENLQWIEAHFNKMESYIKEREKWVIAPGPSTLEDLRKDFTKLLLIYVNGEYGRFEWGEEIVTQKSTNQNWLLNLGSFLIRFIGVTFPLVLMGLYLWKPSLFPIIDVDTTIITFLFISWLLLAVDGVFKLGVVADLVNLAKGIKDIKH